MYFALEAAEQALIDAWLGELKQRVSLLQVLRVGDALWLPSRLSVQLVSTTFQAAATRLGLYRMSIRSNNLEK